MQTITSITSEINKKTKINQEQIKKVLIELKEALSKENTEFEAYIVVPTENIL